MFIWADNKQWQCSNGLVNYSTIPVDQQENFSFPYIFELYLQESILSPEPGQNQKFCYRVTGVGEDTPSFIGLDGWVLHINELITADQIRNIQVFIGGVEQDVVFGQGGNVELIDSGLKFNFKVNKLTGSEESTCLFCFELTQQCPLSAAGLKLFGNGKTANNLTILGPLASGITLAYGTAKIQKEVESRESSLDITFDCPPSKLTIGDMANINISVVNQGSLTVNQVQASFRFEVPAGITIVVQLPGPIEIIFSGPGTLTINSLLSDLGPGDNLEIPPISIEIDSVTLPGIIDLQGWVTVAGTQVYSKECDVFVSPCLLICPADIRVPNTTDQCGANVTYPTPPTRGNCAGVTVSCNPNSGDFFPVGTLPVTCTAIRDMTVMDSCSFAVTVLDNQPPIITCPSDVTRLNDAGLNGAIVNYPNPTVSDNCPGVTFICNPPSGSFFLIGTTVVTCTATDASGNTSSCSFNVTIVRQIVFGQPLITNYISLC